jgi:hypothetical protein
MDTPRSHRRCRMRPPHNDLMSLLRALFVFALGAGAALAAEYILRHDTLPQFEAAPPVEERVPEDPDAPPVVWLHGVMEEVTETRVAIREGHGPVVHLQRLGEGATRFFRLDSDRWRPLTDGQVRVLAGGQEACVEGLLDGRSLLALRVFVGAGCGPV